MVLFDIRDIRDIHKHFIATSVSSWCAFCVGITAPHSRIKPAPNAAITTPTAFKLLSMLPASLVLAIRFDPDVVADVAAAALKVSSVVVGKV